MLVTLVVIGIAVSVVVVSAWPGPRQGLRDEAERLALLLSLAREEAQVRGAPVRLSADAGGYRFLVFSERQWRPLRNDAELRERAWTAPTTWQLRRADGRPDLVFGRDPVDSPFEITLMRGGASVRLAGNGLGRFEVLP
ncbi:MAG: GspH/FimT family pseudopilin [Betaproteobacteria bacterium]|nr:GspH/FimT family pseudopilin [Betaproteobacteria bacterium]